MVVAGGPSGHGAGCIHTGFVGVMELLSQLVSCPHPLKPPEPQNPRENLQPCKNLFASWKQLNTLWSIFRRHRLLGACVVPSIVLGTWHRVTWLQPCGTDTLIPLGPVGKMKLRKVKGWDRIKMQAELDSRL